MIAPKPPGGPSPTLGDDPDALDDLADWLTRDNPQFARNMANRVWYHLMGRGIVEPVDDFRDSNPPSNPALLDALTAEFVARRDAAPARWWRSIMKSQTYGLGSTPERHQRRRRGQLRPGRASASCRPRSCSTRSARRSAAASRSRRPRRRPRRAAAGGEGGGRFPQGLRQAGAAPDLRVRALRGDHAGPGVPAHQRRGRPRHASRRPTTGSAGCSKRGSTTRRSWPSSTSRRSAASRPTPSARAALAYVAEGPGPPQGVGRRGLGDPEQQGVPAPALSASASPTRRDLADGEGDRA